MNKLIECRRLDLGRCREAQTSLRNNGRTQECVAEVQCDAKEAGPARTYGAAGEKWFAGLVRGLQCNPSGVCPTEHLSIAPEDPGGRPCL